MKNCGNLPILAGIIVIKLDQNSLNEIARQAKVELARRHYADYVELVHHGKYKHFRHTRLICEHLQRIVDGEQLHLMIEMPPRSGKSLTVTETFPSYFIGRNPDKRVIASAYSDGLARKFGRLNRNKFAEFGKTLFDEDLSSDNSSTSNWGVSGLKGGMIATGIGGSITGEGADCFVAGTMIQTDKGLMDIKDIHEFESKPLVLSYNHEKNEVEYKPIKATRRKKANEFTRITATGGNEIVCTKEHRVYDNQHGYKQAHIFRSGDNVTVQNFTEEQEMHSMRQREKWSWYILQTMLSTSTEKDGNTRVYTLQKAFRKGILRICKGFKKGSKRFLLFENVFTETSLFQELKRLFVLWQKEKERQQILQSRMYVERQRKQTPEKELSYLQQIIYTTIKINSMLFEKMCKYNAFKKNDGGKEQQLQRRTKLCERIFSYAKDCVKKRHIYLSNMWEETNVIHNKKRTNFNKFSGSSQRRERHKQRRKQSNNIMQKLPYDTSQVKSDAVRSIENITHHDTYVYDIQVEDNHNFFANGILVHNCLLIDDPIKNAKEALSTTIRENIWNEWESTLSTRLHDGASVIVVMTRWHEDDLIGRLLERSPYNWIRLRLPAIAEEDNDLIGRNIGDALVPELGFDEEWAKNKRIEVGERTWASLYQQRPAPATGAIFKRDWILKVDAAPIHYDDILISWDFAFKGTNESDYVDGQVWIKKGADFYMIDHIRKRMDFSESLKAVQRLKDKYPYCHKILIEDKANGPAIINILKRKLSGIIPITPRESKEARAHAVTPFFEAGNVHYVKTVPQLDEHIEELISFPNAQNDDSIDSMTQALNYFARKPTASVSSVNAW